eukprot:CAMPEP_0202705688 /NCGR_PEP_ID=MMETSP1385-20130828/18211_1 /ASSEMBLY_ACC=CAM_ASM_000861 /TAXON_ID=933848 /ORGANISM="Elphidium margaritaceum" /LENGTH=258 /DNA_ID=CAMNT_0049363981 /DNA_START=24 /DNA_END=800 /DNA_ORIENTATION=-
MVIKVAFEKTAPIRHYPKQYPWYTTITKPGRGFKKKVISKWTRLQRVFNREIYTDWFGNSRFLMLVNVEKFNPFQLSQYNEKLRPLGAEMVRTRQKDAVPVLKSMGLKRLANALRSSSNTPTMIIYAYGNHLSPIGNVESIPLIKKIIKEFHQNKRKPNDYILAGAIDKEVLSQSQLVSLLDYKEPNDLWSELNGLLGAAAQIPSMLQLSQMSLVNALNFYVENNGETTTTTTTQEHEEMGVQAETQETETETEVKDV